MSEIFISYAREDRSRIEPLAMCLERRGWIVFWDRKIQAGQQWHDVIVGALDRAERVIVAWSKDSIQSDFVRDEAASAQGRKILVPILLDAVMPPLGFRQIQAADFTEWHGQEDAPALEQLLLDLGTPTMKQDSSLPTATLSAPPRPATSDSKAQRRKRRILVVLSVAAGSLTVTVATVLTRSKADKTVVVATPVPRVRPPVPKPALSVPLLEPIVSAEQRRMVETLRAYYRDLNAGTFDAQRYFAPSVSLYIGMKNPSRAALNGYFKSTFPRMYKEYRGQMLEATIVQQGPRVFAFREASHFVDVTHENRNRDMIAANRVTLDDSGQIIRFEQSRVSG